MKKLLPLVLLIVLLCCVFAGCFSVYAVTFDAQNGSDPQKVVFGVGFKLPQDPVYEGYDFGGWYTTKSCSKGTEWTVPETLSQNITVYAKWTPSASGVYVYFDAQNGTEVQAIEFDENFAMPADPTLKDFKFGGWYTTKNCSEGTEWSVPETLSQSVTVYAKWTTIHDFGDSYLMFVECADEGCNVVGRNVSTDSAKESFVYDFTDEKKQQIKADYQFLLDNLNPTIAEEDYEELFNNYDEDITYVMEQYQYAYVFYNAYFDDESTENFQTISDFYNECIGNYYGLFEKIYDTEAYRDKFFEGWSEEEIKQILALSDSYGNEEYIELNQQIETLVVEYNEMLSDESTTSVQLTEKYKKLVELNNALAEKSGYANYMDYAYEVVYERDYTPSDVSSMREYVKQYIGPSLDNLYSEYRSLTFSSLADREFYLAFSYSTVFGDGDYDQTVTNLMCRYLKQMTSEEGNKPINYFQYANELFKNGNYYLGEQSGAFTYWIPAKQTSILYFSNEQDKYGGYTYQNVFTFVHEFGHYYNGVYNNGLSLSMDHNETQSQGDEMLFLAWLSQNKPSGVSSGYTAVQYEQLLDILSTITISTAVDEFEQAVYSDSYNGKSVKATYSDYEDLFGEILQQYADIYGDGKSDEYWSFVVFDNAGYYISYAMSALPSVEIYVKGMQNFQSAKSSYFKLYTFADNSEYVQTDSYGSKTVTATYEQILSYCGLSGPFKKELYTTIYNYFK